MLLCSDRSISFLARSPATDAPRNLHFHRHVENFGKLSERIFVKFQFAVLTESADLIGLVKKSIHSDV
jgi:hypothetical protein